MKLLGSIETGGTKIVCAVGYKSGQVIETITIPTSSPEINIPEIVEFFKGKDISALGIGSFGPIDTIEDSPSYGKISNTPKLPWVNFDLISALRDGLSGIPMKLVTDVNEAAIGEYYLGAGKEHKSLLYITVGTGIGAGYISDNSLLEGFSSPEMGHILIEKVSRDNYEGSCPYHGDKCLEGLASGTAIEGRWKNKGFELRDKMEVWELEAEYLAKALTNYIYILAPEVIVMGGGIMKQKIIFKLIENSLNKIVNNYMDLNKVKIVSPALGDRSGIIGGLILASKIV
ncbi:MAG: ROK family protein [Tissierella sp.]|nr:ROK family protein [Tissierella sp.]